MAYHRFTDRMPIGDWGHAMFAAGDPDRTRHFGRYHYVFEPPASTPHIEDILPAIRARIERDIERGWSDLDWGEFQALLPALEDDLDAVLALYNPQDIVESAGAWDNGYLVAVAWEVLEEMGAGAVLLDDGAIVFDEALVTLVEDEPGLQAYLSKEDGGAKQ